MTEIQCRPNNQVYPMSQLCVAKGYRNIQFGVMSGTVTVVCKLGQGVTADVILFALLTIFHFLRLSQAQQ